MTYSLLHRKDRDTTPRQHNRNADPVTFRELLEHMPPVAFVRGRATIRGVRLHEQEHERESETSDGEVDVEAPASHVSWTVKLENAELTDHRQEIWSAKAPPIRGPVTEATAKLRGE